jgi:hypothetical protein
MRDDRACIGIQRLMVMMFVRTGDHRFALMKADRPQGPNDTIGPTICVNKIVPIPDDGRLVGGGMNPQVESSVPAEKIVEFLQKPSQFAARQSGTLISAWISFSSRGV